jgi:hypothetical protein
MQNGTRHNFHNMRSGMRHNMHSSTQSGRLANQCDHTQNMFCLANVLADKVMDKSKKRQSPLFDQPTQHPNIRSGMCHNMHSNIQSGRLATQCDHIPNMFFCSDNVAAEKSHGQNRKSVNPRCLTNQHAKTSRTIRTHANTCEHKRKHAKQRCIVSSIMASACFWVSSIRMVSNSVCLMY